jgi:hypothetical protein
MPVIRTNDPLIERLPRKLRERYDQAWLNYASAVRMGGTPRERMAAYERARLVEDELQIAVKAAKAEQKRAEGRAKAKAVR